MYFYRYLSCLYVVCECITARCVCVFAYYIAVNLIAKKEKRHAYGELVIGFVLISWLCHEYLFFSRSLLGLVLKMLCYFYETI